MVPIHKSGFDEQADPMRGRVALITGASSGVGRAIALWLSRLGVEVCAVGRNAARLSDTVQTAQQFAPAQACVLDLTVEAELRSLVNALEKKGRLDILIHSAGVLDQNSMEGAGLESLDDQYAVNVRVPWLLTKLLLPQLKAARGQIVFINSSAGLSVRRPDVGQYAATKHALKAIADSLREEVNPRGIRVLTVYLGRTATPMQEALHQLEGKDYDPSKLIQPDDVASVVAHTLMLPRTAEVTDISIRPMIKPSSGTAGPPSTSVTRA